MSPPFLCIADAMVDEGIAFDLASLNHPANP
jgi:hypothetical protein